MIFILTLAAILVFCRFNKVNEIRRAREDYAPYYRFVKGIK